MSRSRDKGEVTLGTSWLLTENKLVEPTWSELEVMCQHPMIYLLPYKNIFHRSYIFPAFSFLLCHWCHKPSLTSTGC